jgi:pimeloyl-ACP methyl ester carboxylesterase
MRRLIYFLILFAGILGLFSACSQEQGPEAAAPTKTSLPISTISPPATSGDIPRPTPTMTDEQHRFLESNGYLPVFEPAECRMDLPDGYAAECGDLILPEDRSLPDGNQVYMHVVIFNSRSENPLPDPLIYLTGGGGGNELDNTLSYLDDGMDAILDQRDFIMYNQRGAKYSTPYLVCRGESSLMQNLFSGDYARDEINFAVLDFFTDCHNNLVGRGLDLNKYNTAVNADDFNDLRIALGYEKVNIYGTSYGSGLALAILRSYSEHIRSAIIDSVYPPQVWFYSEYGTNANRAFQRIFEACESDEDCSQRYPDVETVMYQVADELNANPRQFSTGAWDTPVLTYNGSDFLNALYYYPYLSMPGLLPKVVYDAADGDFRMVDNLMPHVLAVVPSDTIAAGVQFSILCREESSEEAYDLMLDLNSQLTPQLGAAMDLTTSFEICEAWDIDPAEEWENAPVVSDVPSLVFAGEFDPITPLEWAQMAADTLSKHFLYVMPGRGHGIMRSDPCGLEIGLQFLDDPTSEPDSSCIAEMPGIVFE